MLKLLLLTLVFSLSLFGNDKVEIYATKLFTENDDVIATGGVNVLYKEYMLSAKSAKYDKTTQDLELFGNIRANYKDQYKILGDYARLNLAKKERVFQPFYMIDNKTQVWMSGAKGDTKKENIFIKKGIVSGCDPVDPLWTMEFSSSDYNAQTKWLNLYNARLYIADIAVFYLPWFGYSLDRTRKTGLLKPSLGISGSEGLFYQQPLYIAEQNWWDLEITPQVRTKRGAGIYGKFRFVDSKVSKGSFKTGYFKEKESYFQEYSLQNKEHYGFDFNYENSDILNQWFGLNLHGQSGLLVDIKQMNDVDYINLETSSSSIDTTTATQILSRVNLFYNTQQHYVGIYAKYYQDLTLPNNDNTLQKLPTLQYHYYMDSFFDEHILYNLDVKANNIYRKINKTVTQTDLNIPVGFQTPLFDEYFTFSYTANLYTQLTNFHSEDETPIVGVEYDDGYYARNFHTFMLSTQLVKPYKEYSHVVGLDATYNRSAFDRKTGYYDDFSDYCANPENQNDPDYEAKCEFYNISTVSDELSLDFTQYLYDSKNSEILYHRVSQKIYYDDSSTDALGELENELNYKINSYFSYYNDLFYNYNKGKLSKLFNKITLHAQSFELALSHLYKDSFLDATTDYTPLSSYVTSEAKYRYNHHYSFEASYNYDIENKERKSASIGFMYKKRCWDFGVKYSENNRPILTNDATASSVYDRFVYITVVLKPFMQSGGSLISYRLPGSD